MKQLVNTKDGLEIKNISLDRCVKDVAKNWCKELHAVYEKNGIVLHVLSSGVIFSKRNWQDDWVDKKCKVNLPKQPKIYTKNIVNRTVYRNVDYSKAIPTKLDPTGQYLLLNDKGTKGLKVHQIVACAFYNDEYIKGKSIHHRDNNTLNNQLWNLIPLDEEKEHQIIHREDRKKY